MDPFFTPQFRVIAPEQMGHERTADLVDRPFHYHEMAEDTVELTTERAGSLIAALLLTSFGETATCELRTFVMIRTT